MSYSPKKDRFPDIETEANRLNKDPRLDHIARLPSLKTWARRLSDRAVRKAWGVPDAGDAEGFFTGPKQELKGSVSRQHCQKGLRAHNRHQDAASGNRQLQPQ